MECPYVSGAVTQPHLRFAVGKSRGHKSFQRPGNLVLSNFHIYDSENESREPFM